MALRPVLQAPDYYRTVPSPPYPIDPRAPRTIDTRCEPDRLDYFVTNASPPCSCTMTPRPSCSPPMALEPPPPPPPLLEEQLRRSVGSSSELIGANIRIGPTSWFNWRTRRSATAPGAANCNPRCAWTVRFRQIFGPRRQSKISKSWTVRLCASTIGAFLTIESGATLDRLLQAYRLPADHRSLPCLITDFKTSHKAKLCTILDHLGASRISDYIRMKRVALLPY